MVHNSCKHDQGFTLGFVAKEDSYAFCCNRCICFRLLFSPEEAGKIKDLELPPLFDWFFNPRWKNSIIAYVRKDPATKRLKPLAYRDVG